MIGTLLKNRYRLDAELGHGGMGRVYQGYDVYLERPVAVKVLSQEGWGEESRSRLLNEARFAARLHHPNIVSVFDADDSGTFPFVVMELVEGSSLLEHSPETIEAILSIARQVCSALEHAHDNQVIHRDLKPENVLVNRSGIVKLTDFGLARSFASRLTTEGSITGTVYYLAPELALGRPFDGRVDLYALGVMLYEMVTRRLPFNADNPLAVVSQHVHAPIVPPTTYRPGLSPLLEQLILKLLAKNPDDRYPDARAVIEALDQIDAAETQVMAGPAYVGEEHLLLEKLVRGRLIGRQAEMAELHELWKRAMRGQATLALISGEPGVGKTRLANEMIVYARLSGAVVLRGGCYEHEATTPYLPFVEALREWVRQASDASLAELTSLASELVKLAPEIESRVGPLFPSATLTPNEERMRLFDHFARFLMHLAREKGLLLFIDDIHWVDGGALALLHYLLRNLRDERFMVLACYREVELDRQHPFASSLVEWNRLHLATRLILGRLNREQVRELLKSLFGQETMSDEFTDAILRETEGNPFFVEEVIKSLIEQGGIYREDGRWQRRELHDLAIPQSIREAIGRRLDRQSASGLEMLHTAAALGKRFAFSELAATATLSENEMLDYLDEADRAQLVRPEGNEEYIFTHDKIREVLYEELNPIRRRRLHLRIGEGLEKLFQSDKHAPVVNSGSRCCSYSPMETLSYHFVEAGDLERGLRYSEAAAHSASSVFAHEEAQSYFERALECAQALQLTADQARLLYSIGRLNSDRGSYAIAVAMYQHALALETDPKLRVRLKTEIGKTYAEMGDARGRPYLQEALSELDPESDPLALARVHVYLGRFHHLNAEWNDAIEHLSRARALAEPLDDVSVLSEIYTYLSGGYQWLRDLDSSVHWAKANIALGERTGYLLAVASGYEFLAEDSYVADHWLESLEYAEEDRRIGLKIGSMSRVAWAENSLASAYLGLGDLHKALEHANECVRIVQTTGEERLEALICSTRSVIHAHLGNFDAAMQDVLYVDERAKGSGHRQVLIWSARARSNLLSIQGRWEELYAYLISAPEIVRADRIDELLVTCIMLDRSDEVERLSAKFTPEKPPTGDEDWSPWYWLILARLAGYRREHEVAAWYYHQAETTFDTRRSRLGLATALYFRSAHYRTLGDLSSARRDVERAIELLKECDARTVLSHAQSLLNQLVPQEKIDRQEPGNS